MITKPTPISSARLRSVLAQQVARRLIARSVPFEVEPVEGINGSLLPFCLISVRDELSVVLAQEVAGAEQDDATQQSVHYLSELAARADAKKRQLRESEPDTEFQKPKLILNQSGTVCLQFWYRSGKGNWVNWSEAL